MQKCREQASMAFLPRVVYLEFCDQSCDHVCLGKTLEIQNTDDSILWYFIRNDSDNISEDSW